MKHPGAETSIRIVCLPISMKHLMKEFPGGLIHICGIA
jgi:hypothetical protein